MNLQVNWWLPRPGTSRPNSRLWRVPQRRMASTGSRNSARRMSSIPSWKAVWRSCGTRSWHLVFRCQEIIRYMDAVRRDHYDMQVNSAEEHRLLHDLIHASRNIEVVWLTLTPGNPLVGQTLAAANLRARTGASVVAILRDQQVMANPKSMTVFQANDRIGLIGDKEEIEAETENDWSIWANGSSTSEYIWIRLAVRSGKHETHDPTISRIDANRRRWLERRECAQGRRLLQRRCDLRRATRRNSSTMDVRSSTSSSAETPAQRCL